jgi:leukotriene A-4 hydrolase/aminopeptidase
MMKHGFVFSLLFCLLGITSFAQKQKDTHSFARPNEAFVRHLDLDIEVSFDTKTIWGTATYDIINKAQTNKIYFDTRDLIIEKVVLGDGTETTFKVGAVQAEFMGAPLEIDIKKDTYRLTIHYKTSNKAQALQWLEPQQTAGKIHPFLFTQSQPILARSWIPSQDSPGIRITYKAKVKVPSQLMAVMSANNPTERNSEGIYEFEMKQRIPVYLMALSVGDLAFKPVGKRTGVYTEPSMLDASAYELEGMEAMLDAAENLYGSYRWGRYDVIVLPPSFPYGGMENPRLTFLTPTFLAGDRSLVTLIAHELAHSWSGNLVTNATWDDFWLNEGVTTYIELRIMEELYGKAEVEMQEVINFQNLEQTVSGLDTKDTHLKLAMEGRDPDLAINPIAYNKGALFLSVIEKTVGREKFDVFLKGYFRKFSFRTITTKKFYEYLKVNLLDKNEGSAAKIQADKWIFGDGIPANVFKTTSERYNTAITAAKKWTDGTPAASLGIDSKAWKYQQWIYFLRAIPKDLTQAQMADLDKSFKLTQATNNEILGEWLKVVAHNKYQAAYPAVEAFLLSVGRTKYIRPIYAILAQDAETKPMAMRIYQRARHNYHPISARILDGILGI